MRRKTPTVSEYMSRLPVEAPKEQATGEVLELMESHGVRHIPVMEGGHLYGIVSRLDLQRALIQHGPSGSALPVADFCQREVLTVPPDTLVTEAAAQMIQRKVGSALVADAGIAVGIFTSTDALRLLSEL